jgi:hypothetical protein
MDVYKIGTMTTDVLTGRVTVIANSNTTNMLAATAYPAISGLGAYQVTAGKTLHIVTLILASYTNETAGTTCDIRYADDAALVTNPVVLSGVPINAVAAPVILSIGELQVPAAHYFGVYHTLGGGHCNVVFVGYEA